MDLELLDKHCAILEELKPGEGAYIRAYYDMLLNGDTTKLELMKDFIKKNNPGLLDEQNNLKPVILCNDKRDKFIEMFNRLHRWCVQRDSMN